MFYAEWERRVFGLSFCARLGSHVTLDHYRQFQAALPPDRYMGSSYYERWLHAIEQVMLEQGVATEAEITSGKASGEPAPSPWLEASKLTSSALALIENGNRRFVQAAGDPVFGLGAQVRVREVPAVVYDRLPSYVRDREGVVDGHYGSFANPEVRTTGEWDAPGAHLYRVRFGARELWGDEAESPGDELCVDLFEHYLEPA